MHHDQDSRRSVTGFTQLCLAGSSMLFSWGLVALQSAHDSIICALCPASSTWKHTRTKLKHSHQIELEISCELVCSVKYLRYIKTLWTSHWAMDSDVLKRTNVKSRCRKVMFAPGHGGRSFWGRSSSPRGRRPCTTSTSTTILNTGALIYLRCPQPVGHRRP